MGWGPPTELSHLIRDRLWLRLACDCGHVVTLDPLPLRSEIWNRRKSIELRDLHKGLVCGRCGGKRFRHELVAAPHARNGLIQVLDWKDRAASRRSVG